MMRNTIITKIAPAILLLALATACSKLPENPQAASPQPSGTAGGTTASNSLLPFGNKASDGKGEQAGRTPVQEPTIVPAGTAVTIRLQTAVSSNLSNAGDKFDAVLDAPLAVGGKTIAPLGALVTGRVVAAHRSGRLQDPGVIQLALAGITVDGKSYPVSSSRIVAKGASHKKRNWAMVGGGAGGGALLGGLLGGPKGAIIGGTVGAGAGTTAAYATGQKDVGFGAERRLTFRLTQPVVLQ